MKSDLVQRLIQLAIQQHNAGTFNSNSFAKLLLLVSTEGAKTVLNSLASLPQKLPVKSIKDMLVIEWLEAPAIDFVPFNWVEHLLNAPTVVVKIQIQSLKSISAREREEFEALIFLRNGQNNSDSTWIPTEVAFELLELLSNK